MKMFCSRYFMAIGSLLFFFCACRSSKADKTSEQLAQNAVWQDQPITIDGDDSDWINPMPYTDSKEKLSYAVTNDRDNMYILLKTKDDLTQQKILQGGLTVWINKLGEKNSEGAAGIAFPTGNRSREGGGVDERAELHQQKRMLLADIKDYSLMGFNKDHSVENYDYGKISDEGVDVKINFNAAGELVYEALVPLSAIFTTGTHNYLGRNLTIGIFIDGLLPQSGGARRNGGGGVTFGGGIGMGSFGGGSGMGLSIGSGSLGRIGGGQQQQFKQSRIWKSIYLAKPTVKRNAPAK